MLNRVSSHQKRFTSTSKFSPLKVSLTSPLTSCFEWKSSSATSGTFLMFPSSIYFSQTSFLSTTEEEKKKKVTPKFKLNATEPATSWAHSIRPFPEDPFERFGLKSSIKNPPNFEPKVGSWVSDEIKQKRRDVESAPTAEHTIFDMPYEDYFAETGDEETSTRFIGRENEPKERRRKFNGIESFGKGGRKTSNAFVRLSESKEGDGKITINGKRLVDYFPNVGIRSVILDSFFITETLGKFHAECTVSGGGVTGQSEAVRNAIGDALRHWDPLYQHTLKIAGFLGRDPRQVERKKTGLKKARKTFQWSKR